jgi:hypothetical protein
LKASQAQAQAPAHEVIVVDDASIGLSHLLQRLAGDVEVVHSPRRLGFARAAMLGAKRTRGELIVLLRGAAASAAGWLSALVAELADPAVGMSASATAGKGGDDAPGRLVGGAASAGPTRRGHCADTRPTRVRRGPRARVSRPASRWS